MSLGRPAMRQRERRQVENNLAKHARLMNEIQLRGYDRDTASKLAMDIMKGKIKLEDILEVK